MSNDNDIYVYIIKMKNGDDLVSELTDITEEDDIDGDLFLIKPMKLHTYFDQESDPPKQILFLNPWLPIGIVKTYDVSVYLEDVFAYVEVTDEFKEHYIQARSDIEDVADQFEQMRNNKAEKIAENVYSLGSKMKKKPSKPEEETTE